MNHGEEQQKLKPALFTLATVIAFGTYFYHLIEGWGWIDALYFTVTTATTVGYGDLNPSHNISKLFTVVFILVSVGLVLYSLNIVATIRFHRSFHLMQWKGKNINLNSKRKKDAVRTLTKKEHTKPPGVPTKKL